jgi:MFS family permease
MQELGGVPEPLKPEPVAPETALDVGSTPPDEDWNAAVNTAHGAVQAVGINLYNPFIGINLIRMGGSNLEVGLLSSLPPLASLLSNLIGMRWLARRRNPIAATAALFTLARVMALGLAAVDLLLPHGPIRWWWPATFVAVFGLLNLPNALGNLGWQAVLSGLLSARRRGPALARRLGVASLVGVTVALLAGWWASRRPGVEGYVWLFILAAACGLLEGATFRRFRGRPVIQTLPPHLLGAARRLWHNRPYRVFLLSCLPFYFGWLMAWPLFLKYNVSFNHATNLWMGAYSAVNAVASTAGNALWERLSRRIAVAPALGLSAICLSTVPASYLFHPGLWGVMVPQVLGGLGGGGMNLLLLLRLMEVAPEADRVVAMGVNNAVVGAVGVVGPLVGISLLGFIPIQRVFWVPASLRLLGGFTLLAAAPAVRASLRRHGAGRTASAA